MFGKGIRGFPLIKFKMWLPPCRPVCHPF